MKEISMEYIRCACGKSDDWNNVKGLSSKDKKILNDIGYGVIKNTSFQEYLNVLQNGYVYGVKQTKYDSGDYSTQYLVAFYEIHTEV